MKPLFRAWAVLAMILLFVTVGFADGPAAPKNSKKSPKRTAVAESSATTHDSPAKAAKKAAKPATPAKAKNPPNPDQGGGPLWVPMPATTGALGLFTVETADTLPKRGLSFSGGVNKYSREPGGLTVLNIGFSVGVALSDRFSAYVQFDPERHIHVDNSSQLSLDTPNNMSPFFPVFDQTIYRSVFALGGRPAYPEEFPFASANGGGVGDVRLGLKFGLLSELRGDPVSFAIKNELHIPTHRGLSDLLSSEGQSGQYDDLVALSLSKTVLNHSLQAAFNVGYLFTPDASFTGTNQITGAPATVHIGRADQVQVGVGLLMFPDRRIQLLSEYSGVVFLGAHTPDTTFGARDPVDGVWGVRLYLARWLAFDAGYRYMLNLNQHPDRNGFVFKLGSVNWPEKVVTPDNVTADCSVDKSSITEGSGEVVQAMVKGTDTYNYPLSYTWTATGGKIDGTGPDVRWDSAGVPPGTYRLTATVDNGRGVTSSCSSDVTVSAKPAPPPPMMTCSVDRSSVLTGERVQVTATVNDQTGTPLTYTWQTNGGQVVGTGATVQLDTSGLAPGNYTVTGRVENGVGGAADCSAGVSVQAPAPPPVASKVNECFFHPGSARVDNVCKRVLDDVAVRIQNDPKAKVVVVGYSDPKEGRPEKLAKDRGTNAMKYLSQKKGVAESRVDVRSASGQKGAGKENRRLDIIWVPEGATY
jgi:outer membrane protein OmpA-like peptidoglycan-associated protein